MTMRGWALGVGALVALGCAEEPTTTACVPGQQISCACPGGASGAQRCADDGSRYLGCECAPGDAGTDAGADGGVDGGDAGTPELVYVNWCAGGCTFTPGPDDARLNQSSVIQATSTLSASATSATTRAEVMTCLSTVFAPYHVAFSETDPGAVEHREVAAAGSPTQVGLPSGVAAVSPFQCAGVPNAVTFVFTDVIGDQADALCWPIAQVIGSSFGLDNAFHCPDVMSYLSGCGFQKTFTDALVPCGEFEERACSCGRSAQNSHALMLERAGAAP